MAKLSRVFQAVFGLNGNQSHFGQFGSRATGPGVQSKDPATIQALTAFTNDGWKDAINTANKAPFLEDMNGLFLLIFRQIAYLFQEGNPEWDAGTTYFIGSTVKKTGTFEFYGSLVDNNVGNALPSQTDNASWQYLNPPSVAPGVMADFGGASAPFGWLICDGSVVAQASYPALFTAIGSAWNTGGEGGGNFRLPDLRGRAAIGAGTGSGLTARALAALVGEETHLLVTGEIPSHNHPVTDPGHAHTGNFQPIYGSGGGLAPSTNLSGGTHATITDAAATGVTVGNTGGGGAHNNMQPSAVVNKIIKY